MEKETLNIVDGLLNLSGVHIDTLPTGTYHIQYDVILGSPIEHVTITVPMESKDD